MKSNQETETDPIDGLVKEAIYIFKECWHIVTHPKEQKTDMDKAFRWMMIAVFAKLIGLVLTFLSLVVSLVFLVSCEQEKPRPQPHGRIIRFEDLKQVQPGDYSRLSGDNGQPHRY